MARRQYGFDGLVDLPEDVVREFYTEEMSVQISTAVELDQLRAVVKISTMPILPCVLSREEIIITAICIIGANFSVLGTRD